MCARQWGLSAGPSVVDLIHSSGVAARMFSDICAAARGTLEFAITSGRVQPHEILANYPLVLSQCDHLGFDEPSQALAYLSLHLPDRYCRTFQVLEQLLVSGMLPLGRSASFAAVGVGAGPGPGIFAVRNFYAALSHFTRQRLMTPVVPLGSTAIVEHSRGMSAAMHHFAEQLVLIEQDRHPQKSAAEALRPPHPCAGELAASGTPFGASHEDFAPLDLRSEHNNTRRQLAYQLEYELDTNLQHAWRLAYEEPITVPSAFAIALMTNFLTTTDAVPRFTHAIQRLMQDALVPGGIVVVLGGVGHQYPEIYARLDQIATDAGLHVMSGFDKPLQAGSRPEELATLRTMTRQTWRELVARADNGPAIQRELRNQGAGDIFDESLPYCLPRFRVRVYRRGRWPGTT